MTRFELTGPMERVATPDLAGRLQRALALFPELDGRKITVGLTSNPRLHGSAEAENWLIRLNPTRRSGSSYFTIGHELTHLLQKPGLGLVPAGEVQCDIWTLARSDLFLDDMPSYLRVPCRRRAWPVHARAVRSLCIRAIDERRRHRLYIVWLEREIRQYFAQPPPITLLDLLGAS